MERLPSALPTLGGSGGGSQGRRVSDRRRTVNPVGQGADLGQLQPTRRKDARSAQPCLYRRPIGALTSSNLGAPSSCRGGGTRNQDNIASKTKQVPGPGNTTPNSCRALDGMNKLHRERIVFKGTDHMTPCIVGGSANQPEPQ